LCSSPPASFSSPMPPSPSARFSASTVLRHPCTLRHCGPIGVPLRLPPLCAPPSRHASSTAPLSAVELEPELTKEALSNDVFSGGERVELDPREAGAGATSGWRATPN
jgi:hypothetical protein